MLAQPKNAPTIFPEDVNAAMVGNWAIRLPARYKRPGSVSEVWLYLVRAEVNGNTFNKIGLSAEENPLRRDSKAYKELIDAEKVPVTDAPAIESVVMQLCQGTWGRVPYGSLSSWAGAGETMLGEPASVATTFRKGLALVDGMEYDAIVAALTELWNLQKVVVWHRELPKPIGPVVKRYRELLGLVSAEARIAWRKANGWAV